MTENKRFRVNDLVKYNYSEIGKYIDENHTDIPLRNDEVCKSLNELSKENEQLKQSYKEFEDECQSTFNAMSRKQDDLYRKNFKLKDENEQLKNFIKTLIKEVEKRRITVTISEEYKELLE